MNQLSKETLERRERMRAEVVDFMRDRPDVPREIVAQYLDVQPETLRKYELNRSAPKRHKVVADGMAALRAIPQPEATQRTNGDAKGRSGLSEDLAAMDKETLINLGIDLFAELAERCR